MGIHPRYTLRYTLRVLTSRRVVRIDGAVEKTQTTLLCDEEGTRERKCRRERRGLETPADARMRGDPRKDRERGLA